MRKRIDNKLNLLYYLALAVMGVILLAAVFPGVFTGYDPYAQDMSALMLEPCAEHIFGTDNFGRDIFTRVIYGVRIDLLIGFIATLIPFLFGSLVGLAAGYFGGRVDALIMRVLDVMTAFPFIVLVILIVTILGASIRNLYIAIWLVGWREYAKLVRSEVLVEKNAEYVQAAQVLGFSKKRIMFRHILPNVIGSAFIYGISDIMLCMLMAASLSFLGLGVQPPASEWGAMISEGRPFLTYAWWIASFPGLALAVTGIAISLIGNGLAKKLGVKGR
ncbi:MAG: ABC transporter permease [Lachnospiraceae bacterium]